MNQQEQAATIIARMRSKSQERISLREIGSDENIWEYLVDQGGRMSDEQRISMVNRINTLGAVTNFFAEVAQGNRGRIEPQLVVRAIQAVGGQVPAELQKVEKA